jgi:hypothetical protein
VQRTSRCPLHPTARQWQWRISEISLRRRERERSLISASATATVGLRGDVSDGRVSHCYSNNNNAPIRG